MIVIVVCYSNDDYVGSYYDDNNHGNCNDDDTVTNSITVTIAVIKIIEVKITNRRLDRWRDELFPKSASCCLSVPLNSVDIFEVHFDFFLSRR